MKGVFISMVLLLGFVSAADAAIKGEEVSYRAGKTVMKGYLAWDDGIQGKRPGILVVHEWWGHNDSARERARMLAGLGYTALAVDMYGNGRTAAHPGDAGKFAGEVMKNMKAARARFTAAMETLKKHPTVDGTKIAAIGYCFGGGVVLAMAREGLDLRGVVSFHGSLATKTPARKGRVQAKVLVLNGADDPFVKHGDIAVFKKEMEEAGVDYRFVSYPGAVHAFTNPAADALGKKFELPIKYNAEADRNSWKEMEEFFDKIF